MSKVDPELTALADAARAREAAREAWAADPKADPQLKAPLSAAERQRVLGAVLPPAPPPRRAPLFALTLGGGLAAAAAVLLLVVGGGQPVPPYRLEVRSLGHQEVRGDGPTGSRLALKDGMRLELLLRPAQRPSAEVTAQVFLRGASGERPLAWAPERSPDGALRFVGTVGEAPVLTAADQALVFVVGPPDALAAGKRGPPVQVHVQAIGWSE
jgi:hypothetical protein